MTTNFPSGLDAFQNPQPETRTRALNPLLRHARQHQDINDAVEALEAKVGVDLSADTSSLDYKLTALTASLGVVNAAVVNNTNSIAALSSTVAGLTANIQVFTVDGTWTKPAGAKYVSVTCIGGGGAGGSGRRGAALSTRSGGGGGSAGVLSEKSFRASDLAGTVAVTVPTAAIGGTAIAVDATNGNAGAAGGAVSFGALVYAAGGLGGAGGTSATAAGGAAVATAMWPSVAGATSNGATNPTGTAPTQVSNAPGSGGAGGGITSGNAQATGSAGGGYPYSMVVPGATGGAAGTSSGSPTAGGPGASVGVAPGQGGGGGGSSRTAAAGAGGAGGAYGGGGGGGGASENGFNSGAGGAGGPGVVIVTTYF